MEIRKTFDRFAIAVAFGYPVGAWVLWEAPWWALLILVVFWGVTIPARVCRSRPVRLVSWPSALFIGRFWDYHVDQRPDGDAGILDDLRRLWFFLALPVMFDSGPDVLEAGIRIIVSVGSHFGFPADCLESKFRSTRGSKTLDDRKSTAGAEKRATKVLPSPQGDRPLTDVNPQLQLPEVTKSINRGQARSQLLEPGSLASDKTVRPHSPKDTKLFPEKEVPSQTPKLVDAAPLAVAAPQQTTTSDLGSNSGWRRPGQETVTIQKVETKDADVETHSPEPEETAPVGTASQDSDVVMEDRQVEDLSPVNLAVTEVALAPEISNVPKNTPSAIRVADSSDIDTMDSSSDQSGELMFNYLEQPLEPEEAIKSCLAERKIKILPLAPEVADISGNARGFPHAQASEYAIAWEPQFEYEEDVEMKDTAEQPMEELQIKFREPHVEEPEEASQKEPAQYSLSPVSAALAGLPFNEFDGIGKQSQGDSSKNSIWPVSDDFTGLSFDGFMAQQMAVYTDATQIGEDGVEDLTMELESSHVFDTEDAFTVPQFPEFAAEGFYAAPEHPESSHGQVVEPGSINPHRTQPPFALATAQLAHEQQTSTGVSFSFSPTADVIINPVFEPVQEQPAHTSFAYGPIPQAPFQAPEDIDQVLEPSQEQHILPNPVFAHQPQQSVVHEEIAPENAASAPTAENSERVSQPAPEQQGPSSDPSSLDRELTEWERELERELLEAFTGKQEEQGDVNEEEALFHEIPTTIDSDLLNPDPTKQSTSPVFEPSLTAPSPPRPPNYQVFESNTKPQIDFSGIGNVINFGQESINTQSLQERKDEDDEPTLSTPEEIKARKKLFPKRVRGRNHAGNSTSMRAEVLRRQQQRAEQGRQANQEAGGAEVDIYSDDRLENRRRPEQGQTLRAFSRPGGLQIISMKEGQEIIRRQEDARTLAEAEEEEERKKEREPPRR